MASVTADRRIIPAHAGFTTARCLRAPGRWDHPRTRGVYVTSVSPTHSTMGSSPHTRGLRAPSVSHPSGCRIIPAHAGFTPVTSSLARRAPDHPRTRGVYARRARASRPRRGSSPHTRGLRRSLRRPRLARTDHPRTRGVYHPAPGDLSHRTGSSPHTRGLLTHPQHHVPAPGIIPAHAGFTDMCVLRLSVCRDHPRTRGVYSLGS